MTTYSETQAWKLADAFRTATETGNESDVETAAKAITDYLGIPTSDDPEMDERINSFLVKNADSFRNRIA